MKNKLWAILKLKIIWYKMLGTYKGEFVKNKFPYIKQSLIAVMLGLIISSIVILISGANPFSFFEWVGKISFNQLFISTTLIFFSLYILCALSLSVGFKSSIFNIGIAGQMMMAGCLIIILGIKCPNLSKFQTIFFSLLIAIGSGVFLSFISGILKSFLKINEVLSTIMLNWIVFYFFKWIFVDKGTSWGLWDNSNQITAAITNPNFSLTIGNNAWLLPLIFSFIILILVYIVFTRTRFGYKMKVIGINNKFGKYAGIGIKSTNILVIITSGAIAGIAGMIYYMTIDNSQIRFNLDQIPTFGLNAMSVSLIAFNNPIGIMIVSFFWAIIQTGGLPASQLPSFHISKEIPSLIFGIIIYCSTISILFLKYNPWKYYKKLYIAYKNSSQELGINKKNIKTIKKQKILNNKFNLFEIKRNQNQKENQKERIRLLKQKRKEIIQNAYDSYYKDTKKFVRKKYSMEKENNLFFFLNQYNKISSYYLLTIQDNKKNKEQAQLKKYQFNNNLRELIDKYENNNSNLKKDFLIQKTNFKYRILQK